MGLGMFWWSNRLQLRNLSLIYEIMKICEKKLSTLSTGNVSAPTTFFCKKRDSVVTEGFPVLKVLNFFSQIFIILYMRLKFRRVGLLDHQNMPKPKPHWSKNHFFQKQPIQQFIHNLGSHVWTSCRPPALEFVLYIHFDNSAHEDSGETKPDDLELWGGIPNQFPSNFWLFIHVDLWPKISFFIQIWT